MYELQLKWEPRKDQEWISDEMAEVNDSLRYTDDVEYSSIAGYGMISFENACMALEY